MANRKISIIMALVLTFMTLITACAQQAEVSENAVGKNTASENSGTVSNTENAPADPGKQSDKSIFAGTMAEMTWEQVMKEADNKAVVLFPIAVVEEHGPHMDLTPDIYLTYIECKLLKQNLEKSGIHSVIAPPYYWGINESTGSFPGSFTLKPETLKTVLSDIVECLKEWGFTQVFYVNQHGDPFQRNTLKSSADELKSSLGIDVVDVLSLPAAPDSPSFPAPKEGKFAPDFHAGADETSWVWAFYPDKVNVEAARKLEPQPNFFPLGYAGDPANFDTENGKEVWDIIVQMDTLKIKAYLEQSKK
ncbi:MAG TPA: creatininase family protein [Clostridia bacterium]|nr:creatininase family protein [Clostridia bacterium]